jgi:hypothetical protein
MFDKENSRNRSLSEPSSAVMIASTIETVEAKNNDYPPFTRNKYLFYSNCSRVSPDLAAFDLPRR